MADQQNNSGTSGFFKNIASKLPYQSVDLNRVLQDLNPKYNTFEDAGMRRVEALSKNSIFYNNDYNNTKRSGALTNLYITIASSTNDNCLYDLLAFSIKGNLNVLS